MATTHLRHWAARQPEADAAVFVDPDPTRPVERVSYGALDAAANRLARVLRRAGLRRDDRVAFVLGNEPAVFTVFWAAMRTGLHVVPDNRHLLAPEIRYPDKTDAAYDAAGTRFSVGDVGWLDEDGYLFLTDRDGDLILSGGVNIYPREAENVLLDHPAVADAAVVGVSDADLGQRAVAVVVPAGGVEADAALAEALLTHCREHLARFKCPRAVVFWGDLPRSEAGKIMKREIRTAVEEGAM